MTDTPASEAIDLARARLLRGRGPGATEREVAHHTRDRTAIGGVAVPRLLAETDAHAAELRGDVAALADRVTRQRDQLAADLSVVAGRLRRTARPMPAVTAAFAGGLVVGWLLRSRRGWRSTGGPPASRPARAPRTPRRRRTRWR